MRIGIIKKIKKYCRFLLDEYLYNMKLRRKLVISYILITVFPIAVVGTSASLIMRNYAEQAEIRDQLNSIMKINNIIDFNLEMYIKLSETIFVNTELQKVLAKRKNNIEDLVQSHNFINYFLMPLINEPNYAKMRYTGYSNYVRDSMKIYIYPTNGTFVPDGQFIKSYNEIQNEDWIKSIVRDNEIRWHVPKNGLSDPALFLGRKLVDFENQNYLGILCIQIPFSRIHSVIKKHFDNPHINMIYMDENRTIIAEEGDIPQDIIASLKENDKIFADNQDITNIHVKGRKYIVSYNTSSITGWKLIAFTPASVIREGSRKIEYIMYTMILFSVVICILVSFQVSSLFTIRVQRLIRKIEKVEKMDYSLNLPIKGNDEIGQLNMAFDRMVQQIKQLIDIEYKSRMIRDQTKLELLQEQINPHLLYNTLTTIGWKAKREGNTEVFHVINNLIRFYRTSLNRGNIIIKLGQEFEVALEFMSIMEYTYNLKFTRSIDIDERIYEFYAIKLILQPIVENALFHGIRNVPYPGHIGIKGTYDGKDILIEVTDNGMGMDRQTIDGLLDIGKENTEKGYGLSNVIKRIQLYYGEGYGVDIHSELGKGTSVYVKIPAYSERDITSHLRQKYLL